MREGKGRKAEVGKGELENGKEGRWEGEEERIVLYGSRWWEEDGFLLCPSRT